MTNADCCFFSGFGALLLGMVAVHCYLDFHSGRLARAAYHGTYDAVSESVR